jgi:hypothetical protein
MDRSFDESIIPVQPAGRPRCRPRRRATLEWGFSDQFRISRWLSICDKSLQHLEKRSRKLLGWFAFVSLKAPATFPKIRPSGKDVKARLPVCRSALMFNIGSYSLPKLFRLRRATDPSPGW